MWLPHMYLALKSIRWLVRPTHFFLNDRKAMDLTGLFVRLKFLFICKVPFLASSIEFTISQMVNYSILSSHSSYNLLSSLPSSEALHFLPFSHRLPLCMMELKTILYQLLLNFSFEANNKTNIPLKLKKIAFSMQPDEFHLELKPRQRRTTNSWD